MIFIILFYEINKTEFFTKIKRIIKKEIRNYLKLVFLNFLDKIKCLTEY